MKGFIADSEELTEKHNPLPARPYTGKNLQLVLMPRQPGEEIGEDTHEDRDQFFCMEDGEGARSS